MSVHEPLRALPFADDPAVATARRRRRLQVALAASALALVAVGGVALAIESVSSRAPLIAVNRPPAEGGEGVGAPEAPDGQRVTATDLYSDPVFVDDADGSALATTSAGGVTSERLVSSSDGGSVWRVTGAPFPVAGTFSTIMFVARPGPDGPSDAGYVFGPAGLLVTLDGGVTWTEVQIDGVVQRVVPMPIGGNVWATFTSCPGVPSATQTCSVGLDISTDGGLSWHRSAAVPPLEEGGAGGDVLARVSPDKAYVLSWGLQGGGLVLTVNGGASWRRLSDPCASGWFTEDMAALSAGRLWLICGAEPEAGAEPKVVYRSTDGAASWQLVASTGLAPGSALPLGKIPLAGYVSQLATISPETAWLGLGGVGLAVTRDAGASWTLVAGVQDSAAAGGAADVGVTLNSPTEGWALGFGNAVWRTLDGLHWARVS